MYKFFSLATILMVLSSNSYAVCGCDDDQGVLAQQALAFNRLASEAALTRSGISGRIAAYQSVMRVNESKQLYSTKKLNAADRFKDGVSMKENFESEAASASILAAKIDTANAASTFRSDIGKEAENFLIKK